MRHAKRKSRFRFALVWLSFSCRVSENETLVFAKMRDAERKREKESTHARIRKAASEREQQRARESSSEREHKRRATDPPPPPHHPTHTRTCTRHVTGGRWGQHERVDHHFWKEFREARQRDMPLTRRQQASKSTQQRRAYPPSCDVPSSHTCTGLFYRSLFT